MQNSPACKEQRVKAGQKVEIEDFQNYITN